MNKIEELKFIIGRFDHYFDSVNGKGNLYLTLNTFLLGGAIAGYAGLLSAKICNLAWSELVLFCAICLCNAVVFFFSIAAIFPFVSERQGGSSIFYGDVAGRTEPEWKTLFSAVQAGAYEQDLIEQAHKLATGLNGKFMRLRKATWWILIEFGLFLVAGIYLLIKHYI